MAYDIERPYGPLIETTARVATWNTWARYGPWQDRERGLLAALLAADPDVLVLVEAWEDEESSQAGRLKGALGLPHHVFGGDPGSGIAILSRWPLDRREERRLGDPAGRIWDAGHALYARAAGPRGPVEVIGAGLGWKLGHSGQRQEQVRELGAFAREVADVQAPLVVAGDFNADPGSDEIRALTGRAAVAAPGLVFYDAWETAGDGTPGHTWARTNPWTEPVLWPDRRIDYILSAWPRPGGAGHPVHCELLGTEPVGGVLPSDHYGLVADLRY
ncbi:endonuclease/exonuclease/phosphatase family protein [Spirillospora sp. NPDC029432]|uniref:endonuclease/exonuclease/phosphatase family protein n=1 Tax=Spirillospora sp. NPDC029432 TaxID=3154599 RepID=UPI00345179C4